MPQLVTKRLKVSDKQRRKEDALELAELIYDLFKQEERNGKIVSGQNNAQIQTK